MMPRWIVFACAMLCAVASLVAYQIGRARADGVPSASPLTYGGVLDDGGRPVEGVRSVSVRLWDAATGGTVACTTVAPTTTFTAGRFRVTLDASCTAAVRANPNLWAEVIVDTATFPRSKVGAVPYALEAGRASGAAGPLETRIASVEMATRPRQVEIGRTGSTTTACAGTYQVAPVLMPLTLTATATAIYRLSTTVSYQSPTTLSLRIGAATPADFVSQPELDTYGPTASRTSMHVSALVRLQAGRTYTFNLEYRTAAPTCSTTLFGASALVAEQLN